MFLRVTLYGVYMMTNTETETATLHIYIESRNDRTWACRILDAVKVARPRYYAKGELGPRGRYVVECETAKAEKIAACLRRAEIDFCAD